MFWMFQLFYSVIYIILAVMLIWGFVLFVKVARRAIKALDIYIEKNSRE